jgi:hypothetical protein
MPTLLLFGLRINYDAKLLIMKLLSPSVFPDFFPIKHPFFNDKG